METADIYGTELRRHLRRILAKTAGLRIAAGLVDFLAVGTWIFLCVIVWAALSGSPPLWQALTVSRLAMVLFAGLFFWFVLLPLVRLPSLGRLADEVERRKDFKDIVRAGYEFSGDREASERYAPDLVREVIRQAVRSISGLQVRFLFLSKRTLVFVPVAYGALCITMILALARPGVLFEAGKRVVSPRTAAAIPNEANLFVQPGDITVLSGSDVEVSALDFGKATSAVALSYTLASGFWKTEVPEVSEQLSGEVMLKRYAHTFTNLRNTVSYYFHSGDRESAVGTIRVVHKPIVANLKMTLTPPSYTGEAPATIEDRGGNVQALEGTRVSVEGRSNNPLENAWVRFDENKPKEIAFSGRTFHFDFTALKDGSYTVLLEDTLGHKTEDPLIYAIEVFDDRPPSLDVLEPGAETELPRNHLIDVSFTASDDYGIQDAAVFYRRSDEEDFHHTAIPLGERAGKKEISERYSWSLEHVSLFPGDFVEYYVQVRDNNIVTGPGVAKSRIFQVIVPTMAELYTKIRKEDAERRDLFEEAIQEGRTLRDRLSKLEREFIKTEKLEWSQKKEMDKALASQQSIEEKVEEIRKSLDETLQSLSDNQMTSQRIGEKIEQISELLEEIKDEALKEYIERLQEAMDKLSPEDIRRALRDLNISSEELLKRLERTAQLLEEIRKEQQMEELVRKSEDLTEAQEELNEGTEQADSGDESEMDTLSDQQEELARETDQLKRDIEAFAGEVGEPTVAERLQEASEELSESETSGKMRRASQKLRRGEKREAAEDQEEALENLVNLFTRMCAAQMGMQQSSSRYLTVNLQRIAKQALRMSFKQEDLAHRLQKATSPEQSPKARRLASEQLSHYKALEKLLENLEQIGSKTPAVSVSLMRKLGEALSHMQQAVLLLEQNKAFLSSLSANQAVGFLNEAAIELLERAESCSSGGVSTGLQEMMKQLLAGEEQLMQQTKGMLAAQAMAERIRQERQAQLERLAGYQRSLKDIAEDIERSIDENKELLGRLEGAIKDMEEVIRDFERGDPDEQTLEKETRIISRLLDAQRSVHTRDYEKIRTSVTAKDVFSKGPATREKARTSQTLREAIERAMKLKAPGEFEDLIRLYFRALAEEAEIESKN